MWTKREKTFHKASAIIIEEGAIVVLGAVSEAQSEGVGGLCAGLVRNPTFLTTGVLVGSSVIQAGPSFWTMAIFI